LNKYFIFINALTNIFVFYTVDINTIHIPEFIDNNNEDNELENIR